MPSTLLPRHAVAAQAVALIERIVTRYHDGHRRVMPQLLEQAAAVEASGLDSGLVETLEAIDQALEQHMFKEEMRLFPMMEQGGNTLIGRLIDDLHREHDLHQPAVLALQRRLHAVRAAGREDPVLARLIDGVDDFARELADHIGLEEGVLFALFAGPDAVVVRPATTL